jgi:toxin CcdB
VAQFDVYKNTSKKSRSAYPLLVDIQNSIIDELSTRLVIPLAKGTNLRSLKANQLTPSIDYEGESYLLFTPQMTSMQSDLLMHPIGTLEAHRDSIINAIDFAITGI